MTMSTVHGMVKQDTGTGGSKSTYETTLVNGPLKSFSGADGDNPNGDAVDQVVANFLVVDGPAKIKTGNSNDRVEVAFSVFLSPLTINVGKGTNEVIDNGNIYLDGFTLKC
jgi:hypothetical protein